MKTLNRTLSLALVFALVFSLMSFAFAADTTTATTTTAKAFTDASSITHANAVNTMTSLSVIAGYPDGSYKPAESVTRAQMCKMLCLVLNGGTEPVLSTSTTPKFTDIKGNWAQAYIEYCYGANIVAGMGDGTFHPDDTVTASQAAKMLLVAMGYKADVFGFTGADWEVNVNVSANKAGIYTDITGLNASATCNRDNAAQMIYNALFANTMKISYTQDQATGKITQTYTADGATLAADKFGLMTAYGTLDNVTYNTVDKDYDTTIGGAKDASNTDLSKTTFASAVPSSTDYSTYFGMNVKVLYTVTSGKVSVYGVIPNKSSVVLQGVVGQIAQATFDTGAFATATNMTIGGKTYKFDTPLLKDTKLRNFNVATESTLDTFNTATNGDLLYQAAYNFTALDTNGNGKIDKIVVYPFEVYKVSYVGTKEATLSPARNYSVPHTNSVTKINLADDSVYSGIAADDWVKMTPKANTVSSQNTYTKISAMSGKVTQTITDDLTLNEATINGVNFVDICAKVGTPAMTAGNTYSTLIQVNTFVFYDEVGATTASASNYAVVIKAGTDSYSKPVLKMLFSDGTVSSVTPSATPKVDDYGNEATKTALVEFTKSASTGAYSITDPATAATGGYKGALASGSYGTTDDVGYVTSGSVTYRINDNAIFFVQVQDDSNYSYKTMTGAQVKSLNAAAFHTGFYTTDSSTGYSSIMVG